MAHEHLHFKQDMTAEETRGKQLRVSIALLGTLAGGVLLINSGLGQLFYQSTLSRDYPTIMGILVIGAFLTLVGNLVADISYALADPRVRTGRE